ncbi:MAG: hypothetical protein H7A45_14535 [Verrucomicrobiales bacterium]|nr:hypothetical protein [Verrucomicrobiales bacterium]MCP5526397.1 hypothetical protein [Verrucomicrobiales bacterium]
MKQPPVVFGRVVLALLGALELALLAGCAGPTAPEGRPALITQLNVMIAPAVLNLDVVPGPDGIGVKLHAFSPTSAKSVAIREGWLEFLVYDREGVLADPPRPFHQWSYEAGQLEGHRSEAAVGFVYDFLLSWIPKTLASSRIAVVARYHPSQGPTVTSTPAAITTGNQ